MAAARHLGRSPLRELRQASLAGRSHCTMANPTPNSYVGCAVYVSEARDAAVLRHLEGIARSAPNTCLANLFVDAPYNRTNFTLVGSSVPALAAAAVALARAALAAVDLRQHSATHPRLGAVDHISCHPLLSPLPLQWDGAGSAAGAAGGAAGRAAPGRTGGVAAGRGAEAATAAAGSLQPEQAAAAVARAIAQQLGDGPPALPVFTYGWAHPQGRRLDEVRRQLGYFRGAAAGSWQGSLQPEQAAAEAGQEQVASRQQAAGMPLPLPVSPCYGPAAAPQCSGVCCVGAGPWIVNYNMLLRTDDLTAAQAVARAVSERGGGLPGVQAMALRHADGIEVACNLLAPDVSPPERVEAEVRRLAVVAGVAAEQGYRTNKAPAELLAAALEAGL